MVSHSHKEGGRGGRGGAKKVSTIIITNIFATIFLHERHTCPSYIKIVLFLRLIFHSRSICRICYIEARSYTTLKFFSFFLNFDNLRPALFPPTPLDLMRTSESSILHPKFSILLFLFAFLGKHQWKAITAGNPINFSYMTFRFRSKSLLFSKRATQIENSTICKSVRQFYIITCSIRIKEKAKKNIYMGKRRTTKNSTAS